MRSKHYEFAGYVCPTYCCSVNYNLAVVLAAEEAHKLEIAAKETQIVQFRQELNVIVEQLEAMKQVEH